MKYEVLPSIARSACSPGYSENTIYLETSIGSRTGSGPYLRFNWKDWEGEAATRAWSALLVDIIEEVINKEAIVACFRQEYAAM